MRIGLISDTHVPEAVKTLPAEVFEVFKGVDLILHAGDIYDVSVLDELERIAPVLAARGDDDYGLRDPRVKDVHELTLDGLVLWLSHTFYGGVSGSDTSVMWLRGSPMRNPIQMHEDKRSPDIVVSGHTHSPSLERRNEILFLSPGSATFPNYQRRLGTVALLTIESGKADARIVQLGYEPQSDR